MFYVFADNESIFDPLDDSLSIMSPKVTLELGKSGSFQFSIPPKNRYYSSLEELKTFVRVEIDSKEIFRGRVLSIKRGFNNIKTVYCEGILSYLVDSVQKARRFNGKAEKLYRKILERHNNMVEESKQFNLNLCTFNVENATVVIPGKKEEDDEYYGENKYEQAIIESLVDEWQTTYDYINTIFIDYLGGYLVAKYNPTLDCNYIDYISNEELDSKIEEAQISNSADHEIEFGVNLVDFEEDVTAEDMFTVLIPLGDGEEDVLTIANATNKFDDDSIEIVKIQGKNIGIADRSMRAQYGSIVKTYSFENVNNPDTLFSNAVKYLKRHKNMPKTYTIRAVDLHFINKTSSQIEIGDSVKITSQVHGVDRYLLCTRIEYDLSNPANTRYTFGNPEQSLTERYKKNKDKEKKDSAHNDKRAAKGGGGAAGGARDDAIAYAIDYAYNGYHEATEWIDAYKATLYDALVWYGDHGQGAITSYKWINDYGVGASEALKWYSHYAQGAIDSYKWINDYGVGASEALKWYSHYAQGAIDSYKWINDYGAGTRQALAWYNKNAAGFITDHKWINDYGVGAMEALQWYSKYAQGAIDSYKWISDYGAGTRQALAWYNKNAAGFIYDHKWITDYGVGASEALKWYSHYAQGAIDSYKWINDYGAGTRQALAWYNENAAGFIYDHKWIKDYGAGSEKLLKWYDKSAGGMIRAGAWITWNETYANQAIVFYKNNAAGIVEAEQWVSEYSAGAKNAIKWHDKYAAGAIKAYDWVTKHGAGSEKLIKWYDANAGGIIQAKNWVNLFGAKTQNLLVWYYFHHAGVVKAEKWVDANGAGASEAVAWYKDNHVYSIATIEQTANDSEAKVELIASFGKDKKGNITLKAFSDELTNEVKTQIDLKADEIVASAKTVTIDAILQGTGRAMFERSIYAKNGFYTNSSLSTFGGLNVSGKITVGSDTPIVISSSGKVTCVDCTVTDTLRVTKNIYLGGHAVALKADIAYDKVRELVHHGYKSMETYICSVLGCTVNGRAAGLKAYIEHVAANHTHDVTVTNTHYHKYDTDKYTVSANLSMKSTTEKAKF